jgi:polysaccharide biosynthesis protein PelB
LKSRADDVYAKPSQRERFATPFVAMGIFFFFIILLYLLFPEHRLLEIVSGSHETDAATIRYLETIVRVRSSDTALRLRLAGNLEKTGDPQRALDALTGFRKPPSPAEQHAILEIRYKAMKQILSSPKAGNDARQHYLKEFSATAKQLAGPGTKEWQLRQFADDAGKAGDSELSLSFSQRADQVASAAGGFGSATAGDPFSAALAARDYRKAAIICFREMKASKTIGKRRELFIRGVRALQSGNLPVEAFETGERNIDGLADDRDTLVFMTKAGLAAGKPERAQRMIKRALKMGEAHQQGDFS